MPQTARPLADRFWPKVEKSDGCWLWTGAKDPNGYGRINSGGQFGPTLLAHRVAYELLRGDIDPALVIDHLCRVPSCVNPSHMETVPMLVNSLRGTHPKYLAHLTGVCLRGHRFADVGVRRYRDGRQGCMECIRLTARAWSAKRRTANAAQA